MARNVEITASETFGFRETADVRVRQDGERRPVMETRAGDDFDFNAGKWREKTRRIDRENDWYEETVTDPETGEVIYHCAEPLSEHQGHGSAKQARGDA